jgi:hypothetical protein
MRLLVFLAIFGLVISFSATSQAGWEGDGRALATTANAHSPLLHLVKKNHQHDQNPQKMKNKKNKHNEDSSGTNQTENTQPSSKENSPPTGAGGQPGETPKATLLLPYYEVDTNKPGSTLFSTPKPGK